jgi:glycosyltransferase involved in cell wall biosynthesis
VRRRIVMIGSARDVRGGVSALVDVYFAEGLFDRRDARYIATHCDGSPLRKLWRAACAWLRVVPAMAARRVWLLHVHIATGASFWRKAAFVLPARLFGVPYVLHMHGGDLEAYHARKGAVARRLLESIYSHAAVVIALSAEWQRTLERLFPEARVVTIANPVRIPKWQSALDEGPPTVAFLGIIAERKGVHDLLRAWPAVVREVPQARLVLAGSGDVEAARTLARSLGITSVEFPGWIGRAEKEALLRRAWVFALPSHFEALPMSVLEAMAAGVPVVSTRVGAIPEVVTPECGLLVEPRAPDELARALLQLVGDARLRKHLGGMARKRVESGYSAAVITPLIEAVWEGCGPSSPHGLGERFFRRHA